MFFSIYLLSRVRSKVKQAMSVIFYVLRKLSNYVLTDGKKL